MFLAKFFSGAPFHRCTLRHSIRFSTFQILFYALRPGFVRSQKPTMWHFLNISVQLAFNYVIYLLFGPRPLIYLILSSFFAGSLHPLAGHFIAEHYLWDGLEQETYSYYGILNILAYNVNHISCQTEYIPADISFLRLDTTTSITTFPPSPGPAFQPFIGSHPSSIPILHTIRVGP